jgi:alpha-aminoadipate carrier protein LysW
LEAKCPECDGDIKIPHDVISGEIVSCPDCGMDFEVVREKDENPLLKPAEIEGEDWGE